MVANSSCHGFAKKRSFCKRYRGFFQQILREDHKIDQLQVQIEEGRYLVTYTIDNEQHEMTFDREAVDVLLTAIQNEPKYAD
ncbi:hypothetical protein ACLMAB_00980 [Brevibacillus laterosporus]